MFVSVIFTTYTQHLILGMFQDSSGNEAIDKQLSKERRALQKKLREVCILIYMFSG